MIDDGLHSTRVDHHDMAFGRAVPLPTRFVYLIEDYAGLLDVCGKEFASYDCCAFGMLTVVSRGLSMSET